MRHGPNCIEEAIEVRGLSDVAIRVQVISLADVTVNIGSSENGNRNARERLVLLDLVQQIARTRSRQVEIEKNKIGLWRRRVFALTAQKLDGLVAVVRHVHVDGRLQIFKRLLH